MVAQKTQKVTLVAIALINYNAMFRSHVRLDKVDEYADKLKADVEFDPITIFFDGDTYWLADGMHRLLASKKIGRRRIKAVVYMGGEQDALLHGVQANERHGICRTTEDREACIRRVLEKPEYVKRSQNWIAEMTKTNEKIVNKVRNQMEAEGIIEVPAFLEGKDGTSRPRLNQLLLRPPSVRPADNRIVVFKAWLASKDSGNNREMRRCQERLAEFGIQVAFVKAKQKAG